MISVKNYIQYYATCFFGKKIAGIFPNLTTFNKKIPKKKLRKKNSSQKQEILKIDLKNLVSD